jgi:DNA-directed RNA polymerase omega subunit
VTSNMGVKESKYRFIILAARRARQLMTGAIPKAPILSKRPASMAQAEVAAGLVPYELVGKNTEKASPDRKGQKRAKGAKKTPDLSKKIAS